ncbi:MAG: 1-acyl-sn-glycerol-3-phosphate acyltransferase [Chloroflexota bacterium]
MAFREQTFHFRERITDELFGAFGFNKTGLLRRLFGWMFYLPANRFARMFAEADEAAAKGGLPAACKKALNHLAISIHATGSENLDTGGPLMILSNHPGAYDAVAIGSLVPRKDFSIIAGKLPLYSALEKAGEHLIYAPPVKDTAGRMVTLRKAIDHLKQGGSLLQFGGGTIEPDPAVQPGAAEWFSRWSGSVEIMLRKAPETRVVLTLVSGVLLKRFFNHPLARLRRHPVGRRRLAEFLQILQQLTMPGMLRIEPRLHFAPPLAVSELMREAGEGRLMPVIIERIRAVLREQSARFRLML